MPFAVSMPAAAAECLRLWGIAHVVQRRTEKPGANLKRVWFPGAARDFFPQTSTFSAVSVQPPCAITCINICAHVKNPKHWQSLVSASDSWSTNGSVTGSISEQALFLSLPGLSWSMVRNTNDRLSIRVKIRRWTVSSLFQKDQLSQNMIEPAIGRGDQIKKKFFKTPSFQVFMSISSNFFKLLIDCLIVLIIFVCNIVVFICVCSIARTGC